MEVVTATLERIERANPVLNAFAAVDVQGALSEARKLEEAIAAGGPVGLPAGIPGGVKDLEDVAGLVTSFGSPVYRETTL